MTGYDLHRLAREDIGQARSYSVSAPRPAEGISSALRVAFDAKVPEMLPDEFERLLRRLD